MLSSYNAQRWKMMANMLLAVSLYGQGWQAGLYQTKLGKVVFSIAVWPENCHLA